MAPLTDKIILDDPDPQPLRSSEAVCPQCWLVYARGLLSCPHCEGR